MRGPTPAPSGSSSATTPPPGVCGPDVTNQFAAILRKIQVDFRTWSRDDRERACRRILIPLKMPVWTPGTNPKDFLRSFADINGWDVLPLFQGDSAWLRDPRVLAASCAVPSSSDPSADPFDDAHEDPMTCSDSVQVAGQCWLNGTVNYGTFGIMVRLCKDEFPVEFLLAQQAAEGLIRTYKAIGPHSEDAEPPIKWFRATFFGGPAGTPPTGSGNRPQCNCTGCALDGSIVNWDYVWEPVKPRTIAKHPVLTLPTPAPPVPPPPSPSPTPTTTHTVAPGDTLSKIAQQYYGDPSLWTRIYAANRSVIGPNPNLIFPGQTLVIP
jgi:hypothetical protein